MTAPPCTHGTTNGAANVTMVPAPGLNEGARTVPAGGLIITNTDTVAATVTIEKTGLGQAVRILSRSLAPGTTYTNPYPIRLFRPDMQIRIRLGGAVTASELEFSGEWNAP